MTTLDDCLRIQKQQSILTAPADTSSTSTTLITSSLGITTNGKVAAAAAAATTTTASTLQITLQNNTTSAKLYASITGLDINNNNAVFLLQSDGSTAYHPANPPSDQYELAQDVAIVVGGPGSSVTVTVPQLAGARIWYAQDTKLVFKLNQGTNGAALVEPSVTNTSDANYSTRWSFAEFTFNQYQLFANISYVDFVSISAALQLESSDGSATQTVKGLAANGLTTICEALQAQQKVDCAGWDKLVVQVKSEATGTEYLRALSPNCGIVMNTGLFDGYYDDYVNQVWAKYASSSLTVNTQYTWGDVTGKVSASTSLLTFGDVGGFAKPTAADIFSCSTGAFASYSTNTAEMGNLTARLAAAFNRSTLLSNTKQPNGDTASAYYKTSPTNHYSRIVHAANLDGRGYAFPYDDVTPDDGTDQAGSVASSSPKLLTVYIGGGDASGPVSSSTSTTTRSEKILLREMARPGRQLVGRYRNVRRSVPSPDVEVDEKQVVRDMVQQTMAPFFADEPTTAATSDPEKIDLEKGQLQLAYSADSKACPTAAAGGPPHMRVRFLTLLHQALCYLWMAIGTLARSAWALVPRPVAAPLAALGAAIVASPAWTAATSAASSTAHWVVSSAVVRPLLLRSAVAGVMVLVYMAAGASPLVATLVTAAASQQAATPALVPDAASNGTSLRVQ